MTFECTAYIDEAGDDGFGLLAQNMKSGQSRWLVIGACIIGTENDINMVRWRDEIINKFPKKKKRDLHFRELNHDQKVASCKLLSQKPIGFTAVASNKVTIFSSGKVEIFKRKDYLYNYITRFVLERATTCCQRAATLRGFRKANLRVVFSRRGGMDYQSMKDYLKLMRDGKEKIKPVRSIDWNVLDIENISVENHSRIAGLQISDVFNSAVFQGLEPNLYGNTEPRYALELCPRFISHKGSIEGSGFTLIPPLGKNPLSDEQKRFIASLKDGFTQHQERKRQAPGP